MRLRPRRGSSPPARTRPIRSTLAALLVVPLASLIVLWAYETGITAKDALARRNYDAQVSATSGPGQALVTQFAAERQDSFLLLTGPFMAGRGPLSAQRARTNAAIASFRRSALAAQARGVLDPAARRSLATVLSDFGRLNAIRAAVDIGRASPLTLFAAYDRIVNDTFSFLGSQAAASATPLYQEARATLDMSRALEEARREAALAGGAAAEHTLLTGAARDLFEQSAGAERLLESRAMPGLGPDLQPRFRALFAGLANGSFVAMDNQLLQPPGTAAPAGVNEAGWRSAAEPYLADFGKTVAAAQARVSADVRQQDAQTLLQLGLTGGLGLLAILASLLLLLRFGRRLTRELTSLQVSARQVADERLPQVVQKLRDGLDVDPAAETLPIGQGRTAEIALVAQALATVQRSAIESTVGEARLRHSVSHVFLSLSRRSQSLLHRQLAILDAMERSTSDPETLADLFRLDHLTTRMRRHAEGLIILSGAALARGWREPVPVIDVIRAAIAEVEDYVRVDLATESTDAIAGTAVADVVHLLAELIENATMFSPATTRVEVRASRVGNGFAVEIEDRGIGLAPEAASDLNQRLSLPPEFDLASSDQLGLFVVGRLASRHGIKVALRESAYGGVTSVALLPHGLVLSGEQASATPEAGPGTAQRQVPVPVFGMTGRRQSLPLPPQAPRFMGPALPPTLPPSLAAGPEAVPGPAPAAPVAAVPRLVGLQPEDAGPGAGDEYRGLPRRVRQASLAPQLRQAPPPPPAAAEPALLRSPEEARAMLSSLQRGWQRGREDDDPASAGTGPGYQPAPGSDAGGGAPWAEDEEKQ